MPTGFRRAPHPAAPRISWIWARWKIWQHLCRVTMPPRPAWNSGDALLFGLHIPGGFCLSTTQTATLTYVLYL